ncbi:MAG: 3-deoxy-manno-octulosonate cytidylyltransferase [Candidatus Omnitrophica bacterium]|nr:3-deoxy-manno-octulosonate cytidylyltransferase [Candidatus Omnitrophota bacterium]
MKIIGVIPARYGSERFPGKVLQKIGKQTVLDVCYNNVRKSKVLDRIIIATDSEKILKEAKRIGAEAVLTSSECRSGSDRIYEVSQKIDGDIFVNIQADEPFMPRSAIEKPVSFIIADKSMLCATSATEIRKIEEVYNPNITKVVFDRNGFALYFSASPIPYPRQYPSIENGFENHVPFYKHIGVYVFRKKFLGIFSDLPVSFMEKIEKLEQLRILENGYKIKVAVIEEDSISIDTAEDLKKVNS